MKFHLVYVGFLDGVISTCHQYHLLLGIRRCHQHIPGAHWGPIRVLAARTPQPDSNRLLQQLPALWLFTSHVSSRVSRVQNHRPGNNSQRGEVSTWAVCSVQSSRQGRMPAWADGVWGQQKGPMWHPSLGCNLGALPYSGHWKWGEGGLHLGHERPGLNLTSAL